MPQNLQMEEVYSKRCQTSGKELSAKLVKPFSERTLRAKLNFPIYLQDNKNVTKGKILTIYQYIMCERTPFCNYLYQYRLSAFYLSCEYKYFKTNELHNFKQGRPYRTFIVGKGGYTSLFQINLPFSKIPPFQKSKMPPPFIVLSVKQKY